MTWWFLVLFNSISVISDYREGALCTEAPFRLEQSAALGFQQDLNFLPHDPVWRA